MLVFESVLSKSEIFMCFNRRNAKTKSHKLETDKSVDYMNDDSIQPSTRVLVAGAGGFIGTHLVTYLKNKGYWVRGVDIKYPQFSETDADEFELKS